MQQGLTARKPLRAALFGCLMASAAPLSAQPTQDAVSQAVVQPLPPKSATDLSEALQRLARNSRDVDALIDAGNASLAVGDVDAAIGFFGRADELSPVNARIKVGLAGAFVRRERPLEALRLFDEAEQAGAATGALAGDRGLAYDLVGDNAAAQNFYQQAMARKDDDETRRRLALSHAIAGNRSEFEKVLYPLLKKQDFAAYRTRAFGMAILGEDTEAVAIAEAVMPRDLSARIAPYLRYMPRLTKAQQAAAANLGIFPRAAQIGRDDPRIAEYAGRSSAASNADARLAPQGEPLGRRVASAATDTKSPRRRPDRGRSAVPPEPAPVTAQPDEQATQSADLAANSGSKPVTASAELPQIAVRNSADNVQVRNELPAANSTIAAQVAAAPASVPPANMQAAAPSFDFAQAGASQSGASPVVVSTIAASNTPVKTPPDDPATVAEAFANFSLGPSTTAAPGAGAVDITTIKPPREVAKPPEPKTSEPPKHPERFWVQVATGKNVSALKFDWRRISRSAQGVLDGKNPHVTPWGQSNRLLAGPYASLKEARNTMNSLKENGVDSFTFTSPEGQEIDQLK
ncbi:tetratricopeptide repeat protein [Altererythrobacter luteolus]|uniref:Tetratricopeptide repeat protein n=2 Tax=Pontixanthobacter luteolus TaxID=295089 RepID=A0A6I4V1P4_9SPHN|nr:tetratricopeptide repeat protein [Pontixanthobacter luteolus]